MNNKKDETSRLKLVASNDADYADMLSDITTECMKKHLNKQKIAITETLSLLDPNEDNSLLRDWMVTNDLITKAKFDQELKRIARNRQIEAELGFVPKDVSHYVTEYTTRNNITLRPNGTIKRQRAFAIGSESITSLNANTSDETQLIFDVANTEGNNLESLSRELRLLSDKLFLGYKDSIIGDAVATWQEDVVRQAKVDALLSVKFQKGKATGEIGQKMWADMEEACFDVSDTQAGFAIAIIKKFMWQVKRKGRGLPITDHLMPVISGAQGKGKTQFVIAMTKPLEHLKRNVDFNVITDGKTIDIWSSLILFIDEMGFFTKTDVDNVKNAITAETRTIRAMRQNSSAEIANNATLIGCTNKSLGQLVRDDTGVRRFAELVWRNDPNWELLNSVDWQLLWQSVDENGQDPIKEAGLSGALVNQQEENRNQNPIEMWARLHGGKFTKWTNASDLHVVYREWEEVNFPRLDTNVITFGRTLTSLISTILDFPMEKQKSRNGVAYRSK